MCSGDLTHRTYYYFSFLIKVASLLYICGKVFILLPILTWVLTYFYYLFYHFITVLQVWLNCTINSVTALSSLKCQVRNVNRVLSFFLSFFRTQDNYHISHVMVGHSYILVYISHTDYTTSLCFSTFVLIRQTLIIRPPRSNTLLSTPECCCLTFTYVSFSPSGELYVSCTWKYVPYSSVI